MSKINNPMLIASEQIKCEKFIENFINEKGEDFIYQISDGKETWENLSLKNKVQLLSWYSGSLYNKFCITSSLNF